jgi:hypothetical protein
MEILEEEATISLTFIPKFNRQFNRNNFHMKNQNIYIKLDDFPCLNHAATYDLQIKDKITRYIHRSSQLSGRAKESKVKIIFIN